MQTIRLTKEQFPYMLRQIPRPPKFLDCAGAMPPSEDYKYLCVIGSRKFDEYGKDSCIKLLQGLKGYPIVIVSGLAIGIDSIAHEAALESELKTIAFPGSGLDRQSIYPNSHWALAKRIVESGNTLLSPFERFQTGAIWTFPVRNQLMAGSSQAVLIIEGHQGSGTLLTAEYATQFNRDVLIVPGSIFSELTYGPHLLYRDGATPVTSSEEILIALGFDVGDKINSINEQPKDDTDANSGSLSIFEQLPLKVQALSMEERKIINFLRYSKLSSSELIQKTHLTVKEVNITLSELELRGFIKQEGQYYKLM